MATEQVFAEAIASPQRGLIAESGLGNFIKPSQLAALFGVTPQTIRRWEATGVLPRATRIGPRSLRWSRYELAEHFRKIRERQTKCHKS